MKKLICLILSLVLILSISVPAFAAESSDETLTQPAAITPRYRETVVAIRSTPVYTNAPQLNESNPIIAYASEGSRFNLISVYAVGDVSYYYVSIIDIGVPSLAKAKGYILASDYRMEVG